MEPEVTDIVPAESVEAVPASQPIAEAPVEPVAEVPEPQLFDLPDGRKVDGQVLYKEYTENLLPEFTRRSQELARLKTTQDPTPQPIQQAAVAPWEDPAYVPQTVPELMALIDQRDQAKQQARSQERAQIASNVDNEIKALKDQDPNLDENKLFEHALKYRGMPLAVAYQNMKDMGLIAKTVEQRVAKNLSTRASQPIAGQGQGGASSATGIDYSSIRNESPKEMLKRISSN